MIASQSVEPSSYVSVPVTDDFSLETLSSSPGSATGFSAPAVNDDFSAPSFSSNIAPAFSTNSVPSISSNDYSPPAVRSASDSYGSPSSAVADIVDVRDSAAPADDFISDLNAAPSDEYGSPDVAPAADDEYGAPSEPFTEADKLESSQLVF